MADRQILEKHFGMAGGYVLNFSDRTFGKFISEAVGLDIHAEKYTAGGTSKANKLRTFWKVESDYMVGKLILALVDYNASLNPTQDAEAKARAEKCRHVATRLLAGGPSLSPLKEHAKVLNANHLAEQIRRLEAAVEHDPSLAIGTAKELIETCCKTILAERGKPVSGTPDVSTLTKETLKELKLVPEGISDAARGADLSRRTTRSVWDGSRQAWEFRRFKCAARKAGSRCSFDVGHFPFRDTQGDEVSAKKKIQNLRRTRDLLLPRLLSGR